ncbi:HTH_XRE domain containing protein [uncultured Caudovirales phage]|uniref:HTH_XRE domain containing protein n=1 Tax=uncultured Caudovirales phage TaxID=2100421 RepID=A0A6J5P5T5_9CAUD|nr:HTH_XRE domain containing protein [uncultured Caudovirales phage]
MTRRVSPIVATLAARRRALGMTQDVLADACGWSPALISKWETGKCEPRPAQIDHVAKALKARVSWSVEDLA